MTTAVIGEFTAPHDAVTLYNHHLLDELCVTEPLRHADIADLHGDGVVEFGRRVRRLVTGADRLIYLTRCWDRPSLLHLLIALGIAKRKVDRIDLVIHSELFAFFGPMRSRHVGWPLLKLCFSMADSITCADQATAQAVRQFVAPGVGVAVQPMMVPTPIRHHEATTRIEVDAHPTIVVSCDEHSATLIEDAHQLAAGLFLRTGTRPMVVVLAHGDAVSDDHRVTAWVRDPSPAAAKHWMATAIAVLRPVRCMGGSPLPTEWFMLERPEVRTNFGLDAGTVVLRRPMGDGADPDVVHQVADDVAVLGRQTVLLTGVFGGGETEETSVNRAIRARLQADGHNVRCVELPADGFDGETVASFRTFLRRLRSEANDVDMVICLTQGYTRPSLLLLLATAMRVRRNGSRLRIVFHRDLFDFWSKLRSRNAGLPLLFSTFSIADRVYATAAGTSVALQYKNVPAKFVSVSYPDPPPEIDLRSADRRAGLEAWFADFRRVENPAVASASERLLSCDGVTVGGDDAVCLDLRGRDDELVDRLVLIRKGATDVPAMVAAISAALRPTSVSAQADDADPNRDKQDLPGDVLAEKRT